MGMLHEVTPPYFRYCPGEKRVARVRNAPTSHRVTGQIVGESWQKRKKQTSQNSH